MSRLSVIVLPLISPALSGCVFAKLSELVNPKVETVAYETIYVPPGTFMMGSPPTDTTREKDEAQREVTIEYGFHMMKIEVTQKHFQSLMRENPSFFQKCGSDCPVEMVTWYDAVVFANVLSEHEDLEICYHYKDSEVIWTRGVQCKGWRLPTEAEWEYAARGGGNHQYSGSNDIDTVAWYGYSKSGKTTHSGCKKKANGYGFCDMSGNVSEWVWNGFTKEQQVVSGTQIRAKRGQKRGHRGGGWFFDPGWIRTADRDWLFPSFRTNNVGIRLLRTADPSENTQTRPDLGND